MTVPRSLLLCLTILLDGLGAAAGQPVAELSGRVVDAGDQPIAGARVEVYRGSRSVGTKPCLSDVQGHYSVTFPAGSPIDTVLFDHRLYNPGILDHISGAARHTVTKTLYRRDGAPSYYQIHETLSAYERIIELGRSTDRFAVDVKEFDYTEGLRSISIQIERLEQAEHRGELATRLQLIHKKWPNGWSHGDFKPRKEKQ